MNKHTNKHNKHYTTINKQQVGGKDCRVFPMVASVLRLRSVLTISTEKVPRPTGVWQKGNLELVWSVLIIFNSPAFKLRVSNPTCKCVVNP